MQSVRSTSRFAKVFAFAAVATVSAQSGAEAGDVKAGRVKADKCAICHGLDGVAKISEAPNLAGQNERYLIAQLSAFQKGDRTNEMMSIVIKDLSPTDIEDLAAYYSAIPVSVGNPPTQ